MDIKTEIREIALSFIESAEMVEHILKSAAYLNNYGFITIIINSRASLENKISAIRLISAKLKKIENGYEDWTQEMIQRTIADCAIIVKIGEFALNEMTNNNPAGTVFINV